MCEMRNEHSQLVKDGTAVKEFPSRGNGLLPKKKKKKTWYIREPSKYQKLKRGQHS